MSKIPSPLRLLSRALPIAIACFVLLELSGCGDHNGDGGHHGGGDSIVINEDSVAHHIITIAQARAFTKAFRATLDTFYRLKPEAAKTTTFIHAEEFPSDLFYALLKEKTASGGSAKGVRIYLGKDSTGQIRMVLVPVDSLGNDMIGHLLSSSHRKTRALSADDSGDAGEIGQLCPTVCDNGGSGLNN